MLLADFQQYFFGFSIFISSLFLVMLVLVQRGRGGGLTGALGGAGGQSAFGTKAGDLFTRITIGVAAVWIFLCAAAVFFLRDRALPQTGVLDRDLPAATGTKDPGTVPPAGAAGTSSGVTDPLEGAGLNLTPGNVPVAPAGTGTPPAASTTAPTGSLPVGETSPAVEPSPTIEPSPAVETAQPSGDAAAPATTQPAQPGSDSSAAPDK